MNASLEKKLQQLLLRFEELTALLSDNSVASDPVAYTKYSKEYSELNPLVQVYQKVKSTETEVANLLYMQKDPDPQMRALAEEEYPAQKEALAQAERDLEIILLPKDPNDNNNIFLEIRGGAGGDEAAIFAGDLFRMYSRYCEERGWALEVMSVSEGEHGGYKEVIAKINGEGAYGTLKFESGAHRVQRVPETESQGRIHTSTCTVAIMPEVDEKHIQIESKDLRIDTYRASGAGGQHVNKTDSAVRITHIPTGVVVECQEERSQHKNKARALSLLGARLEQATREKHQQEQAQTRKSLVGTGDRSERIRTYNYPQGRVTDHRINLSLYCLDEIMNGKLNAVVEPLIKEHQAELLAQMHENN